MRRTKLHTVVVTEDDVRKLVNAPKEARVMRSEEDGFATVTWETEDKPRRHRKVKETTP